MSQRRTNRHRKTTRRRVLGWLIAVHVVLFSSPVLPGWLALAAGSSGTRLVELCTAKGLRLVAVPVEETLGPSQSDDGARSGFDCAACPLGKCSASEASFGAAPISHLLTAAAGDHVRMADAERLPATRPACTAPHSRAPPAA